MLLTFLEAIDDAVRERVLRCDDEEQLETWAAHVLVAVSLDEVFA